MENKQIKKLEDSVLKLQEQIEQLKNEKPKFEVGKWYRDKQITVFCEESSNNSATIYGCGVRDNGCELNWADDNNFLYDNTIREATDKEVEEALIKEAKKRGFKDVKHNFIDVDGGSHHSELSFKDLFFLKRQNFLCDGYGNVIFKNGKWAEIISEPKVIINGYEMEQRGNIIKFG